MACEIPKTPCWYCEHFNSINPRSEVVSCSLKGSSTRAAAGCGSFLRVPGVDDDAWTPLVSRIAPYTPDAPPVPRARSRGTDGWWTKPGRPPRATPAAPRPDPVTALLATRDPFRGYFLQDDD